jgi:hypothetical protein
LDGGTVAALFFGLAGFLQGHFLGRRGWRWLMLALVAVLGAVALGLWWASGRAEGMRSLAYLAVMTGAALPALGGAAIGGSVGWWQRQRHGA